MRAPVSVVFRCASMNSSARAPVPSPEAFVDPRSTPSTSDATLNGIPRVAVMAATVAAWMGIGWALHLGAVAYLLTGIPLTVAFQMLVARRPITSLWLVDSHRFHLDRVGVLVALGLAALPAYATALGLASGRPLDAAYGLVGVAGAVPAAFALRAMDPRARTALIRSVLTAGVVAAALFIVNRVLNHGPTIPDLPHALEAF